ncbi:DNA-binding CopG-like domain-containing protein [Acidithiobacillus ferrivorans SS3]|uniref:DNA-binding CopG-like domain-containing protein n=1 Tax=Acidithiobacillus ferrivorans SS3 TaxID=743299 RepID=G0JPC6_9PROT|nr:CopG family ribbon-helix-helix protein [Acidithiobacillus ferrivorans]AEM47357.1 DNA-binding CopG-like domain-containing protein [Acidithiobacillus ferrivorans SS3]
MSSVLTIRVPEEVQHDLGSLAEMTGRSRSWLAMEAIKEYLEREQWQVSQIHEWQVSQIHEGLAEADAGDFATTEEVSAVFDKWASRAG